MSTLSNRYLNWHVVGIQVASELYNSLHANQSELTPESKGRLDECL